MDIFFRKRKQEALLNGLFKSDLTLITNALEKIKDVNFVITQAQHEHLSGHTPLSLAVCSGQLNAAQLLLEHGSDPNSIVFKDPKFKHYSPDLLPSSPLYFTLSNSNHPNMEDIYQLLRDHHADMLCNKSRDPDYGLTNATDDVNYSVQTKLEKLGLVGLWQQWEDNYQSARMKKVLSAEIGEPTAPVRKSKI